MNEATLRAFELIGTIVGLLLVWYVCTRVLWGGLRLLGYAYFLFLCLLRNALGTPRNHR